MMARGPSRNSEPLVNRALKTLLGSSGQGVKFMFRSSSSRRGFRHAKARQTVRVTSLRSEDVLPLRMKSLLLAAKRLATPGEIVTWFGAMQAQDLNSGQWSFGVRLPGSTVDDIERATRERQIMRTWPMRGTVHFVPPEDAKWMLELTGVRALAGAASRRETIGLSEADANLGVEILLGALSGGKQLTRAACVEAMEEGGVASAKEHSYHLLWFAAQQGVTTIGPHIGKEQTFVLLDEWVSHHRELTRDEALATLATRYFRSHGPTTRQDFAGWTGLTAGDAKRGIEAAGDALTTVDIGGVPHTFGTELLDDASDLDKEKIGPTVLLLPGFDEYILGYKDRSRIVPDAYKKQIVPGNNGVFLPTIVSDGRVIGTWKRDIKKSRVEIRALPFEPLTKKEFAGFTRAAEQYAAFLELPAAFPER